MKKILLSVFMLSAIMPTLVFASIDTNLTYGSSGSEVTELQNFLIQNGFLAGQATGNFFSLTKKAVIAYQTSVGLPASGFVGPMTRAKINSYTVTNPTTSDNSQSSNLPTPKTSTYSTDSLYASLSPQLAYITCNWYNRYGNVLFSQSSNGILNMPAANGTYFISTVNGGVTNTSYTGTLLAPGSCNVQFPAGTSLYAGGSSNFTVSSSINPIINLQNNNVDYAQVVVATPNNYLANYAHKPNYCSTRELVGDSIAVFGWPLNSSFQTLTGTITGTSGYYDTTNITVPNGMLGSTAVSLNNGCVIGQINSVGQIADIVGLGYTLGF